MTKEKIIIPEIEIQEPISITEDREYVLNIPISKFPAGIIIHTACSINEKEINTEQKEAAFGVIGERAASLAKSLLNHECIIQVVMFPCMIRISKGEGCSWEDIEASVFDEISEVYKKSGFAEAKIVRPSGEVSF